MRANTLCPICGKGAFRMATSVLCVSSYCDNYGADVTEGIAGIHHPDGTLTWCKEATAIPGVDNGFIAPREIWEENARGDIIQKPRAFEAGQIVGAMNPSKTKLRAELLGQNENGTWTYRCLIDKFGEESPLISKVQTCKEKDMRHLAHIVKDDA